MDDNSINQIFLSSLKSILDKETSGVFYLDKEGTVKLCEGTVFTSGGFDDSPALGHKIFDTLNENSKLSVYIRKALKGEEVTKRYQVKKKHIEAIFLPQRNNNGNVNGLIGIIKDITAAKLAESAFLDSEKRYRVLFDRNQDSVLVYSLTAENKPGNFVQVNEKTCKKLQYKRNEFFELSLFDIEKGQNRRGELPFIKALFQNEHVTYETTYTTKSGEAIPVEVNAHLFKLADRQMVLSIARDLSELKHAELAVSESEDRYESLVELSPDGIIIHQDFQIVFINSIGFKLLGLFSPKEAIGKSILDFVHPEYHMDIQERVQNVLSKKNKQPPVEYRLISKSGREIDVEILASFIAYNNRPSILAVIHDIRERKIVQREILNRQMYLENILAAAPNAIITQDTDGKIKEWNRVAEEIFGYTKEEAVGKNLYGLITRPDVYEEAKHLFEILKSGNHLKDTETIRYRKDSTPINVVETGSPLTTDDKVVGMIHTYRDMAEIHEAEIAIKKSEQTLRETLIQVATALTKAQELRDPYTSGHGLAVSVIAKSMAEMLGWDGERILGIELAGLLHDIGKLGVPIEILTKPSRLKDYEYDIIKYHPDMGYELLKDIPFPFPIAQAVHQHHERINGTGYPQGLKGNQIIPEAKILAVSDVLDAMTAHRPYRPSYKMEEFIEVINKGKGKIFDPEMVEILLNILERNDYRKFWAEEK